MADPKTNVAPFRAPSPSNGRFAEIGRTGLKRYGGRIYEEFLTQLRGRQGARVYKEMRDNDSIIGAGRAAINYVLQSVSMFVRPASSNNIDLAAANHVIECMGDMSHTWANSMTEALTALDFGWAWQEIVYKIRKGPSRNPVLDSKFNDGKIGWRKITLRSQESLEDWKFDDEGEVTHLLQTPAPDYKLRKVPIEKSILYRISPIANNPEGRSIYRNCYRAWYIKKNIEELEAIGVERDLIGVPVITPPEDFDIEDDDNAAVVTKINELIFALRRDDQDGILLPYGWTLDLLGSGKTTKRQFDVDKIINRWDKRIAISLLAMFIMLGMDRVGSFALSKNQNDLFLIAIQGYLKTLIETSNRFLIRPLMRQNPEFAKLKRYPEFVPGKVSKPDLAIIGDFLSKLGRGGFIQPTQALDTELQRIAGLEEQERQRMEVLGEKKDRQDFDSEDEERRALEARKPSNPNPDNENSSQQQQIAASEKDDK
jgi:hypothetical protein